MTTKSMDIQKNSLSLPRSWKNTRAFISISSDSLVLKKIKPLDIASIKEKLKLAGKNISKKDIPLAIKNVRKQK